MKKHLKPTLILLSSFALLSACSGRTISNSTTLPSSSLISSSSSIASYLIKFVNEDGTVLQSSSFKSGTLPVYNGATPTKSMTATTYYVFSGWSPSIARASGDATYTAVFTSHDIAAESLAKITFVYDSASATYQVDQSDNGLDLPAVIVPPSYDDGSNGSHPVTALLDNAFWRWEKLEQLSLPTTIRSIGNAAFSNCSSLTEVTIPEGVTEIGMYAFQDCPSLTKISFPSTVSEVGIAIFYRDYFLKTIEVASGSSKLTTDSRALFLGTSLVAYASASGKDYVVPEGIKSIELLAFTHSDMLETISLPASLTTLWPMEHTSALKKITLAEGNTTFSTDSRSVIDKASQRLCAYANASGATYTIPDGVVEICENAFVGAVSLTSITAPSSLTKISQDSFMACTALEEVTIPDTVTTIQGGAFSQCQELKTLAIPSGLTKIDAGCFLYCEKINKLTLPSALTEISQNAFYGAESLDTLNFSGTMSAWSSVKKGSSWHEDTPLKSVLCSDGTSTQLD